MSFKSVDEQMATLTRGCDGIFNEDELRRKVARSHKENKPLRVKLGMDPTAPDIHLGHTVQLRKMRQFQDFGHKAVLIIGDYTARIGDPSGRTKTRPVLSADIIKQNAETYFQQAGHVLDSHEERLEIHYNNEWLALLDLADILRLMSCMTVAQMLQRESYKKRMAEEKDIVLNELLYPLMQGYDSVAINADVELGGTDQTFNNLVGRDLMGLYGGRKGVLMDGTRGTFGEMEKQVVMIMPILRGLDGVEKMSKSLGNYIGLTDTPKDMFGKTMSIADSLMKEWFTLLTLLPPDEVDTLCDGAKTHPRDAKVRLAKDIVTQYYDAATADREEQLWQKVIVEGGMREDIPVKQFSRSECDEKGEIWLPHLLKHLSLVESANAGRRLIAGGGVSVNREKVKDPKATVVPEDGMIVQVGKRKVVKLDLLD